MSRRILVGVEIKDEPKPVGFTDWYPNRDFMTLGEQKASFDMIVSNPPYYCAEEIIHRAWGNACARRTHGHAVTHGIPNGRRSL